MPVVTAENETEIKMATEKTHGLKSEAHPAARYFPMSIFESSFPVSKAIMSMKYSWFGALRAYPGDLPKAEATSFR